MVYIYLDDDAVEFVREATPPTVGQHVRGWVLPVTQACEWPRIVNPNRLTLDIEPRILRAVRPTASRMKFNTPSSPEVIEVIHALKEAVDDITVIRVPRPEDKLGADGGGEATVTVDTDYRSLETVIAEDLANDEEE